MHVRQVPDRARGRRTAGARSQALADSSLTLKPGKDVLEIAVTDADKGTALRRLVAELGAGAGRSTSGTTSPTRTASARCGPDDVTVKIGDGPTEARYRVADLPGALALLRPSRRPAGLTAVSPPARRVGGRARG